MSTHTCLAISFYKLQLVSQIVWEVRVLSFLPECHSGVWNYRRKIPIPKAPTDSIEKESKIKPSYIYTSLLLGESHKSAQIWRFESLLGDVQRCILVSYIFVAGGLCIWKGLNGYPLAEWLASDSTYLVSPLATLWHISLASLLHMSQKWAREGRKTTKLKLETTVRREKVNICLFHRYRELFSMSKDFRLIHIWCRSLLSRSMKLYLPMIWFLI